MRGEGIFFTFAIFNNGARMNVTNFGQKTVWTEDDWELHYYWVASVAIPVGKGVKFVCFLCFFFRVGKSLACHSPAKRCLGA